jgi:hypothetical protein
MRNQRVGAATETAVDPNFWTVNEALLILGYDITPTAARRLVKIAGIEPAGPRRHSSSTIGRRALTFKCEDLIQLFSDWEEGRGMRRRGPRPGE